MARVTRPSAPATPVTPARSARPVRPLASQVLERSKKQPEPVKAHFNPDEFVSSGSTLLNLALTDHPDCGWQRGKMANVIGDSSSGKTFLTLTAFAEAANNDTFDDYDLIMDDAEHANEFNIVKLFGKRVDDRIMPPATTKDGDDNPSELIEDFHANIRSALKRNRPFMYILDSMDALDSEADQKKIEELHTARAKRKEEEENGLERKTKEAAGSYGMAKAKKNSEILRDVTGKLEKSDSILLIISQTRDNIDPMSFSTKTRSGGKALKFYATHELWTACGGILKSRERNIGVVCKVKVSKNKITGKVREVEFPIYYDYGIDNIGSIIDFLVKEKCWKKADGGQKIDPQGDLGLVPSTRAKLIKDIEDGSLEDELNQIVAEEWKAIEDSLKLNRKSKYE